MKSLYPCLDPSTARYTGCLGASACRSTSCWAGRKPTASPRPSPTQSEADEYPPCEACGLPVQPNRYGDVPLRHPECLHVRFCGHCGQKYTRPKGTCGLYCSETCRYQAMMQRRRARQVGSTERGLKYTGATAERS